MAAPEAEEPSEAAERDALRDPEPRLEELGLAWVMGYLISSGIYRYYLKCWVTDHLWGEGGEGRYVTILGGDQDAGLGVKMKKLTSRLA